MTQVQSHNDTINTQMLHAHKTEGEEGDRKKEEEEERHRERQENKQTKEHTPKAGTMKISNRSPTFDKS